jgi:nucleotide-binding universal stress UspA family protein
MHEVASPILFPPLLLATDGSSSARLAQKWLYLIAQTLPQPEESRSALVMALMVQPRRSSRSSQLLRRIRRLPELLPDEPQDRANPTNSSPEKLFSEASLTELLHTDFPTNFPISVEIRRGRPATEILSYARTIRAGLIAVGSRGTGGVRELLLGSVSAVVARYSSCSVLVARGVGEAGVEPRLKHVLVVVGTSPATQAAIITTQQLVSAGIQQVTLLHVQPFLNIDYLFGPFVGPTPSWQLNQSLQKAQREQGERILRLAKEALETPGLQVETLLQTSEPGPLICQVAQQQGVDLVILGSDRKRRSLLPSLPTLRLPKSLERNQEEPRPILRNARLGPTADYTIHHAPCPVLICRSG